MIQARNRFYKGPKLRPENGRYFANPNNIDHCEYLVRASQNTNTCCSKLPHAKAALHREGGQADVCVVVADRWGPSGVYVPEMCKKNNLLTTHCVALRVPLPRWTHGHPQRWTSGFEGGPLLPPPSDSWKFGNDSPSVRDVTPAANSFR